MRDKNHNNLLLTLEHSAQFFKIWLRQQLVASWVEVRQKKEEEEEQQVLANLAGEIEQLKQESQRAVIIYQPPYVQATPLYQIQQVPHTSPTVVSPSSSSAAPELTTTDIQLMIDAKLDARIQSLEAKFEECLSRVEEQVESNYQKLIDAFKKGERRQKKEAKKERKKEDQARRQIFEDQLKLMQDMVVGSKRKKDDETEKKGEEAEKKD